MDEDKLVNLPMIKKMVMEYLNGLFAYKLGLMGGNMKEKGKTTKGMEK